MPEGLRYAYNFISRIAKNSQDSIILQIRYIKGTQARIPTDAVIEEQLLAITYLVVKVQESTTVSGKKTTSLWLSGVPGATKLQFDGKAWTQKNRDMLYETLTKPFRAHKGLVGEGTSTLNMVSFYRISRTSDRKATPEDVFRREAAKLLYRSFTDFKDERGGKANDERPQTRTAILRLR